MLYSDLAVPYDIVTKMRGEAVYPPIRVLPLETFYSGTVSPKNGPPQFTPLDDENKPLKPQELDANFFYKSIQPYELVALSKLDKLRKEHKVADYEELLAEEQIVSAVLRFHNSGRASGQRKGDWSEVEHRLRTRLMEVMLKQFALVTEASDWETAFTLASRLADTFPGETEQQVIAPLILDMVQKALAAKQGPSINTTQLRDIHVRLRALTEQFPNNLQMQKLKQSLKSQAEKLLAEAVALEKSTNKKDLALAQEKLNQAAELWPTLPGLENHLLDINRKARVLKVGVRQPLTYMSPNTARTDSELRVLDMLFESLVKFSPDASGKGHFRSGLAEGRPQVVELGRRFQLSPNALWWDGQTADAVSLNDIRTTFRAFKRGDGPDHSLAWENLYGDTEVTGGSDGMGVTVRLSKGYLEPLSLMNLKIVPARALQAGNAEDFGKHPVGSGPFIYAGTASNQGHLYTKFVANVKYGKRAGKQQLPLFDEVQVYHYDKIAEAREKNLTLLLDLKADDLGQLPKENFRVPMPADGAAPNRRVYYLAINHRQPALSDENVRAALSLAINREALLDTHFRGSLKRQIDKALNGPYPAHSWACDPKLVKHDDPKSCDPFEPGRASTRFRIAVKKLPRGALELTLKFPEGDPALKAAMNDLALKVEEVLKEVHPVRIRPEAVEAGKLQKDLDTSDFQLAYCHYDFPDDTFWLGPLFAPKKLPGGDTENIFGYQNDTLMELLQKSIDYREFARVQEYTRIIHSIMLNNTPVIPLWQLDPLNALSVQIEAPPFDPLRVFTDIERWHLK